MKHEPKQNELEEEIDFLMVIRKILYFTYTFNLQSSDIIDASMSTKPITFNRLQTGWFFRQDKSVRFLKIKLIFMVLFRKRFMAMHRIFLKFKILIWLQRKDVNI